MRRLVGSLVFLLMVGGLAVGLRLLREVPAARDADTVRSYGSLELVQRRYKKEHILTPAYFPEALEWPPYEIFAGREPAFATMLHFRSRHTGELVLAVGQAKERTWQIPSRIDPARVSSTRPVDVNGARGELALGTCAGGGPCNRVVFARHDQIVTVVGRLADAELLRLARSLR